MTSASPQNQSSRIAASTGKEQPAGRRYWLSLDDPQPSPVADWKAAVSSSASALGMDRRRFLGLMAASTALAGGQGCRRPDIEVLPYAKMPELVTPGMPLFYATSLPGPGGARPVLVETHEGRPTKIEGHPDHPFSRGATDLLTQARVLELYDPDRSREVRRLGEASSWDAFDAFAGPQFARLMKDRGKGLYFLEDAESMRNMPALSMLRRHLENVAPFAQWHSYRPYGDENVRQGAQLACGRPLMVRYRLDRARVILSLDCDFLGVGEANSLSHVREFTEGRQPSAAAPEMNRLYVVEPMLTVTGGMADHRLRLPRRSIVAFVQRLARELGIETAAWETPSGNPASNLPGDLDALPASWIHEVAADLRNQRGTAAVMVGRAQPPAVHALVHLINQRLENLNRTVVLRPPDDPSPRDLTTLVEEIDAGLVDTLVILEGNPAYDAPADLKFADKLRDVAHTIRFGLFEDETSPCCSWHVPAAHPFESWSDAETLDGDYSPVQPMIAPLYGGRPLLEFVAGLIGYESRVSYEIAKASFAEQVKRRPSPPTFDRFLHDGWLANARASEEKVQVDEQQALSKIRQLLLDLTPKARRDGGCELTFHLDSTVFDGRFANNGWLQEAPDPLTKLSWDNAALVSPSTAQQLGVSTGDVVRLVVDDAAVEIPVCIAPGQADWSLAVSLGYGRRQAGRIGNGVGVDVYPLRHSDRPFVVDDVRIEKTGRVHELACTQSHWAMEGRDLVQEFPLAELLKRGDASPQDHSAGRAGEGATPDGRPAAGVPHAASHLGDGNHHELPLIQSPPLTGEHQWGMTIDLNRCIGCSACMLACQSENNIPIVGKDEVANGRSMHWIRVDRYFEGDVDEPSVVHQPVACVHCESAPCETVCPVNAAVHSPEGLNLQVYNRCVGTRYCSNNCPYKVRRFNWFDYQQRPLDELRLGPLAPKGSPETLKMQRNPDVTVRMRGVMEKCTYCVQRIERAKVGTKLKNPTATHFEVPDGTITPACAQACPANAITFGNLSDARSQVSQRKRDPRHFQLLEELGTRPRTSYLARVRNPNPRLQPVPPAEEGLST